MSRTCRHISEAAHTNPGPRSAPRYIDRLSAQATSVDRSTTARPSAVAFDGNVERRAHLPHAVVAQSSEALHEDRDGHALDRVEVDRGSARDWIVVGL
jgi:hypothetical protein